MFKVFYNSLLPGLLLGMMSVAAVSATEPAAGGRQKRVLIIGMDGTRPDALLKAETPTFDELIETGAFTQTAQILGDRYQQNNTISGPSWSSILTGVWADKHGVHDNEFGGRKFELFPHFFKRVKRVAPETKTVSLVSWGPIHEYILSEADIAAVESMPRRKNQTADLRVSAGKLQIDTRDGKWHHLLATRESGTLKLYLDGQLCGQLEGVNDSFELGGTHLFLGRDTRTGDTCFQGQLDEVRFWQRAMNEQEVSQQAAGKPVQNRQGLLAEYLFDEPAEGAGAERSFRDTAGHAAGPFRALVLNESTEVDLTKNTAGNSTSALDLSAAGGKEHGLQIPLSDPLQQLPQGDFTIAARFRTTDAGRNILLGNFKNNVGALNLELHENNSVRVYVQPPNPQGASSLVLEQARDQVMAEKAAKILREDNPQAMFVYFHQVDATGHTIGFSPEVPEYIQAIENVDQCAGVVLQALRARPNYEQEDWLTIVCTDHGGIQRTHSNGHEIPEIRRVFLILNGPSVERGEITEQAYLVDVAATALQHLLGSIEPQWQLDGKAVGLKAEE